MVPVDFQWDVQRALDFVVPGLRSRGGKIILKKRKEGKRYRGG